MSTELIPALTESLMPEGKGDIEALYEKVYRMILEAFSNGTLEQTRQQFSTFYYRVEQIESLLGLDESLDEDCAHLKAYYFGQIKSMADLLSDVASMEQKYREISQVAKDNEQLTLCLQVVNKHPRISGKELRQSLQFKNSSTLSRFIGRIAPYELFYIQKIGSSNHYSLSPNGREYLRVITSLTTSTQKMYDESFILLLLSAIYTELQEPSPSAARVISKVNQGNQGSVTQGMSILIKGKIDKILSAQKNHLQNLSEVFTRGGKIMRSYISVDTNYLQDSYEYVIDADFYGGGIYEK